MELREENIKEMFTIEDSKMYLRDIYKEILERQNLRYKYSFEKMKTGLKHIKFNMIPSIQANVARSLSAPDLYYKRELKNKFD